VTSDASNITFCDFSFHSLHTVILSDHCCNRFDFFRMATVVKFQKHYVSFAAIQTRMFVQILEYVIFHSNTIGLVPLPCFLQIERFIVFVMLALKGRLLFFVFVGHRCEPNALTN